MIRSLQVLSAMGLLVQGAKVCRTCIGMQMQAGESLPKLSSKKSLMSGEVVNQISSLWNMS